MNQIRSSEILRVASLDALRNPQSHQNERLEPTQRLSITKAPAQLGASTLTYPLKVYLKVANNQSARVLLQANGFEFGKGIQCHPKATVRGDGR